MADTMSKWLYDQIAQYLTEMGLGDLFVNSTDGTPGGWLPESTTQPFCGEQRCRAPITSLFSSSVQVGPGVTKRYCAPVVRSVTAKLCRVSPWV